VSIGAVVIPIYQTNSREECAYLLSDSGSRALVCENEEQAVKIDGLESELPALEHTFVMDRADGRVPLAAVAERGRALLAEEPAAVAEARQRVSPDDVLTYIYTSGTTGPPKGCVITHGNFVSEVDAVDAVEGLFEHGDRVLLFLPLAHNFARLVELCAAKVRFTLAFCPEVTELPDALAQVRPTLFPSVPRLYEKMHAAVQANIETSGVFKRRLAQCAFRVGRRTSAPGGGLGLTIQRAVADKLVFSTIRKRLGGRLRVAVSGGAPIAREILEFFAACGVLILEGYGLSETTSGCTMNRPNDYRFGTVGKALPGIELALADDGEILVRGPTVFRGYAGRDEETAEVLTPDGWFRTGDIGAIDHAGFLTVTDRKKEIIVTAGGKKIAPQNLENALKASGLISQALVCGDRRPYIVALLCPDRAEIAKRARTEDEVHALLTDVVAGVNAKLGRTEQIKRFAVLGREFALEEGELTPTLKLRRRVCEQNLQDEIERLYGGSISR
jgi:long-chain acyl-CoA synthetase